MRSRSQRSRVSHERWLVSYADFITLLFAFFVVLYAFAKADAGHQAQVSSSIDHAFRTFGIGSRTQSASAASGAAGTGSQLASPEEIQRSLGQLQARLTTRLAASIHAHAVAVEMRSDGLVISLREAGFFNSGSAAPKPIAQPTLSEIVAEIAPTSFDVRIEGHTDNVPIHNSAFDSNWDLSTARAVSIARLVLDMHTIDPVRISAAGYAEFHPVAPNDTEAGRALNRRVDLVVAPHLHIGNTQAGAGH